MSTLVSRYSFALITFYMLYPTKGMTLAYRKANRKCRRFIFVVEVYRYKNQMGEKKFYIKSNLPYSLIESYGLIHEINQPLVTSTVDTLMMKYVDEFCLKVEKDKTAEAFFFRKDLRITPREIKNGSWDLNRELGYLLFKNWKHLFLDENPRLQYLLYIAIHEGLQFASREVKVNRIYRKSFHRHISNDSFAETYVEHYRELKRFYRITFLYPKSIILVAMRQDNCLMAIKVYD